MPHIAIGTIPLTPVNKIRVLGLIIDINLSFWDNIKGVCVKAVTLYKGLARAANTRSGRIYRLQLSRAAALTFELITRAALDKKTAADYDSFLNFSECQTGDTPTNPGYLTRGVFCICERQHYQVLSGHTPGVPGYQESWRILLADSGVDRPRR